MNRGEETIFGETGACRSQIDVRQLDWDHITLTHNNEWTGEDQQQQQVACYATKAGEASLCSSSSSSSLSSSPMLLEQDRIFDVILGSDVVCTEQDADGVVRVIVAHLERSATARCIFVIPHHEFRYGSSVFVDRLVAAGLEVLVEKAIFDSSFCNSSKPFAIARTQESGAAPSDELLVDIEEKDIVMWNLLIIKWRN
jgi:hypothetical protein